MGDPAILAPFAAMLLLTFGVWLYMYVLRIGYMKSHRVNTQDFRTPAGRESLLPETVNYASYNFQNLLELPVIFYVVCLALYVTGTADTGHLFAAWVFVAFRVMHSLVHCTFNRVILRFGLYMVSAIALWIMVARFILALLT